MVEVSKAAWVVLVYRAPARPSRHRVAAWRRLKAAGAVYLQDSVCALPDHPPHRDLFASVSEDLQAVGGEALVLRAAGLDTDAEQVLVERFNTERDHDYEELGDQCAALIAEVRREQAKGRLTYAAVEDTEGNLARLRRWADTIHARDFFHAPGGANAETELERAAAEVEAFANRVADHTSPGDRD